MFDNSLAYLLEELEAGATLPMSLLYADMYRQQSGSLDATVIGSYYCDRKSTHKITTFPVVGLIDNMVSFLPEET